jgi:putative IMPACT (imprinted ancient) family translation regulator
LSRAYSSAAEAVMSALEVVQHEPMVEEQLQCDFSQEQMVRHWAAVHGAELGEPRYSKDVILPLRLPERHMPALIDFCRRNGLVMGSEGKG